MTAAHGIDSKTDEIIEKKEYCLTKTHKTIMSGIVANKVVAIAFKSFRNRFFSESGIL